MAIGENEGAAERLRAVTEALEEIVRDRSVLGELSTEERARLVNAAGDVFNPDVDQRRDWARQIKRREKIAKRERDEAARASTGIRVQRERPVFTTPNVFAPAAFEQVDVDDDAEFRELVEPRHCYVCKEHYARSTTSTTSCARRAATSTSRSAPRPPTSRGRVALLTGGRVKIGYQAGIKLLRAGAQLIVTTRFPRDSAAALRAGARLRGVGRTGSRSSGSTCATRRASRRSAGTCSRPATGSTSSSTTPARPCAARPSSTAT